jgi:hypothetical protein
MIENFSDLIQEAKRQPQPQRLLLVFCKAELPKDATPEEAAAFERGEGGALAPAMCVDKLPGEIDGFEALCAEAAETGNQWDILFVGALSGRAGQPPSNDEADQPLRMMVESIRTGHISHFLAINRQGQAIALG